jgi:thiol:disulfide interchange protein DsbD
MKLLRYLLLLLPVCVVAISSSAQMIEDPTTWKYEVKKKSATEYQLIFHLDLKEGWHIWSLHVGGDGYQIVPSFTFDKNPKIKIKGAPSEKGKAITTTMEMVEGKVTYLTGKADYTQDIVVTGPTKITGKHTYQVCNDKMCLAPKDRNFVFEIK